jgi:hypothetical protein
MSAPAGTVLTVDARIAAGVGRVRLQLARFARLSALVMAAGFVAYVFAVVIELNGPEYDGESVRIDFVAFWAAAKLALAGQPLAAFDPDTLRAALALPPDAPPADLLWLYPPTWHIAILPLGFLPFSAAWLVFSAVAFAAYAAAMRPLAAPLPGGSALVLAGPPVMIILSLGNNSLLWTAALVAALAGLLIALLTVKPQLGLVIPLALIAGGHWRALLWACLGTAALVALSTAAMGLAYWQHFFAALRFISGLMQTDIVRFDRMMTWYALARLGGADHALALPVQLAVTTACALAVAWIWSRPATADLKAAALCIAIPLATPYAYHYEMTLTLAAAMFLTRDGFGATPGARLWLLALWLGPVPGLVLLGHAPPVIYAAPLLTATLALCLWRARSSAMQSAK